MKFFKPHYFTKWDVIPFSSYIGFVFAFTSNAYQLQIAFATAILALLVTYFCKWHEDKKPEKKPTPKDADNPIQFRIFSVVFGIIAALAIAAPLESVFSEHCKSNDSDQLCFEQDIKQIQDLSKILVHHQLFVMLSFYAIGVLFYHGCILVLSGELSNLEGKNRVFIFLCSLIVFFEGIVLFVASNSTDNIEQFSLWIIVLLVADDAWVLANSFKNIDTLPQWLHLNTIMILFLLVLLFYPEQILQTGPIGVPIGYWALLFVFVFRTVIDYKIGWNYWAKMDFTTN